MASLAQASFGTAVGTGPTTVSHGITIGAGANRLLVAVILGASGSRSISGVAYTVGSGGAWQPLIANVNGRWSELWFSIAPATGAVTVEATLSAASDQGTVMGLFEVVDADQTTGMNNGAQNNGTGNTINVSSAAGDMTVFGGVSSTTPDPILSGTQVDADGIEFRMATNPGAATTTFTYTANGRSYVGGNVINGPASGDTLMGQGMS